jgi:hypothetical protein
VVNLYYGLIALFREACKMQLPKVDLRACGCLVGERLFSAQVTSKKNHDSASFLPNDIMIDLKITRLSCMEYLKSI